MAESGSVAVLSAIVNTGSAIRDLVDTGYRVSAEFKAFQLKMDRLNTEKEFWEAQIVKFGLSNDSDLLSSFHKAATLLKTEETKLTNRKRNIDESCCHGFWPRLKMALFPSDLEQTIVRVTGVFDEVLNDLKRMKDIEDECQRRVDAVMKPSLSFREDRRYIPLKKTEEEVMMALNTAGPALVLLHGFSGTGKSSLARNVALQMQTAIQKRKSKHAGAGDSSQTSNSITDDVKSTSLVFEEVVYLECGHSVDLQTTRLQLRGKLGWNPAKLGNSEGEMRGESDSDAIIKNSLFRLLKERSLLIILDDVWKSNSDSKLPRSPFLQDMIDLGGDNVKWLVTSQAGDLCEDLNLHLDLNFTPVGMEAISDDVARRILALQIGLEGKDIPRDVQEHMDNIIRKVDANPLALTCIAPAIYRTRFTDESEWGAVLEDLASHLQRSAGIPVQSKVYGRSYWEAIGLGFTRLTKQHQNLLILVALCKGPSVPEEIIQFLYRESKDPDVFQSFSEARRDLQGRHLVHIAAVHDKRGSKETRAWSTHALIKEFVMKHDLPKDDRTALTQRLLGGSQVVKKMAALYFDDDLQIEFIQLSSADMSPRPESLSDVRRQIIEPIARLLVRSEGGQWTPILHSSTRKVFLDFVAHGQFDEDSTSQLLHFGESRGRILDALMQFSQIEKSSFVGQIVIVSLVRILENTALLVTSRNQEPDLQLLHDVSTAISQLVKHNVYHRSVKRLVEAGIFTEAFTQLINLLTSANHDQDSRTQLPVLAAILWFAASCPVVAEELGNAPELLEGLWNALRPNGGHDIQAEGFKVLGWLVWHCESVRVKLVNDTGMLERLVETLKMDDHHRLQKMAARVFRSLIMSDHTVWKDVNFPGVLEGLINGLGRDKNRGLQEHCADAFYWLANNFEDDVRVKLVRFPNLVQELIRAVGKDANSVKMKAIAGRTLGSLALADGNTRSEMLKFPGVQEGLVDAASRDDNNGTAISALLLLCPERRNEIKMHSAWAYRGRGVAEAILGLYQEALEDLNEAYRLGKRDKYILSRRCYLKGKLLNFEGALLDANLAVELRYNSWTLLERGVVKYMLKDLLGALADLDESLELFTESNSQCRYFGFKYRGL